jgi:hypothetical protein
LEREEAVEQPDERAANDDAEESSDSEQALRAKQRDFKAMTGIKDSTLEVLRMKERCEAESRHASLEKRASEEQRRKIEVLHQLSEKIRQIFSEGQSGAMSIGKLVERVFDGSKSIGQFQSKGK